MNNKVEERIRMEEDYMVHIHAENLCVYFEVYPVQDWERPSTGEKGMDYIDKENEPDSRDVFEQGKCLMKLNGSFVWRGVWDGRLYFPDEEYWGEEIEILSRLYNDKIVPWCKAFIKSRDENNYINE